MLKDKRENMKDYLLYDNVFLGVNVKIGYGSIIYPNAVIGDNTYIGAYSIIGEPDGSFYKTDSEFMEGHKFKKTVIGANSIIRSHSIIYEEVTIGENFQSGHRITIREKTTIGNNCSIGTLSDIQGYVNIGNFVRIHSNVHIGQFSEIEDCAWLYPFVVLTNDPYPPMNYGKGVKIKRYAIVSTSSTILPGIIVGENALVGAHSVVTKNVDDEMLVVGNPAKKRCNVREIRDENGNSVYPWKEYIKDYRGYPWQVKE